MSIVNFFVDREINKCFYASTDSKKGIKMVYVTPLNNCFPSYKWPHRQYAHLTADSLEELQDVGQQFGLPAWRLQKHKKDSFPRYVITPGERSNALSSGIQAVSLNRLNQKGV